MSTEHPKEMSNLATNGISTRTLVEQAVELIENLILNGEIKAGARLREQELEKRIGISRTPIREALLCLESRGMVESFPRRGSFVKTISIREISDVVEIRIALEGLAVRLAHQRLDSEGLSELKQSLKRMKAAVSKKDTRKFIEAHEEYHAKLISLSENEWLKRELSILRKITRWHRFYFQYSERNFKYSLASHELQYKLLSDPLANEDELVRVDTETTRRGCELLIEHIRKNEENNAKKMASRKQ